VRQFCSANAVVYQGFSLLTANRDVLVHPEMAKIAKRHGRTVCQIVFRFALDVGMIPLTGTSNPTHMQEDLEVLNSNFRLDQSEVDRIENLLS
jgi:diketogulonate reductase-like aldo/keto reductase